MKKIFVLLAMCAVMASCGNKVESTLDKMYDACMDKDVAAFTAAYNEMEAMQKDASAEERKEMENTAQKWATEHPTEFSTIMTGAAELGLHM